MLFATAAAMPTPPASERPKIPAHEPDARMPCGAHVDVLSPFVYVDRQHDIARRWALFLVPLFLVLATMVILDRPSGCHPPRKMAERDMTTLMQMLEMYRLQHDRPPRSLDQLVAAGLLRRPSKDPWGGDYQLLLSDDGERWAIRCAGPDGEHGTLDDMFESWAAPD